MNRAALAITLLCLVTPRLGGERLRAQAPAPPLSRLIPVARIGDAEGVAFTDAVDVVLGPSGRVYLGEGMEKAVLVFERDGMPVGRFGRPGRGPGEFQSVTNLGFQGDTLWVSDVAAGRVTFFLADGSLVRTIPLTSPASQGYLIYPSTPQVFMADGSAIVRPYVNTLMMDQRGLRPAVPVLRMTQDNVVLDTLAWHQVRNSQLTITGTDFHISSSFQPFDDSELMKATPDGRILVFVERFAPPAGGEGRFSVTGIDTLGDTCLHIIRSYTPVPVSGVTRDSLIAVVVERLLARPRSPTVRREIERGVRDGLYVPAAHPPVSGLLLDTAGRIWIRREGLPDGAATWEILDETGRLRGRIAAPAGAHLYAADRVFVWGLEYDEFGAPSLVKYRIEGEVGA